MLAWLISLGFACTSHSDRAANVLHLIFKDYAVVTCYDPSKVDAEPRSCRDEAGLLRLNYGRNIVFSSATVDIDSAALTLRERLHSGGCENLWSDFPEASRVIFTWQGPVYFDAFECSGLQVSLTIRFNEDGVIEYVLTIPGSSKTLRGSSPHDWVLVPPKPSL